MGQYKTSEAVRAANASAYPGQVQEAVRAVNAGVVGLCPAAPGQEHGHAGALTGSAIQITLTEAGGQ